MDKEQMQKFKDYVKKQQDKGFKDDLIKAKLKKVGVSKEDINELFKSELEKIVDSPHKEPFNWQYVWVIGGGLLIIAVFILLFSLIGGSCDNDECFLEYANNCKVMDYTKNIDTTVMKFSVSQDCILTKEIIGLDESEPQEIVDLFLNSRMFCSYPKGEFPEELINSLSNGLEYCEGELKENFIILTTVVEEQ